MAKVFISYRHHDVPAIAARLGDSLGRLLGEDNVFRDIDQLDPGIAYADAIDSAIRSSDALVVPRAEHVRDAVATILRRPRVGRGRE